MFIIKKIITFEKELFFKTKVSEITSISLEHKINKIESDLISGIFNISGDYKITDGSITRDKFEFNIDFDIALDKRYKTDNLVIDIDDFKYHIINDERLVVNIDLYIDGETLKEDTIIINNNEAKEDLNKIEEPDNINIEDNREVEENILQKNIIENINENETFSTYYIHIVKEEDTIDKILTKYEVSKEDLNMYNNLDSINLGDKIIIPSTNGK